MSLTDDTRSVNYDHNMFIIQATGSQRIIESSDPYHEGSSAGYSDLSAREDMLFPSV